MVHPIDARVFRVLQYSLIVTRGMLFDEATPVTEIVHVASQSSCQDVQCGKEAIVLASDFRNESLVFEQEVLGRYMDKPHHVVFHNQERSILLP